VTTPARHLNAPDDDRLGWQDYAALIVGLLVIGGLILAGVLYALDHSPPPRVRPGDGLDCALADTHCI
jgi:hypothetical protein